MIFSKISKLQLYAQDDQFKSNLCKLGNIFGQYFLIHPVVEIFTAN